MADKKTDAPQEPADTYHRHGELDSSVWDEQPTVTGRPNDKAAPNSTFGERAKAATKTTAKAVKSDETEDKSVKRAGSKRV